MILKRIPKTKKRNPKNRRRHRAISSDNIVKWPAILIERRNSADGKHEILDADNEDTNLVIIPPLKNVAKESKLTKNKTSVKMSSKINEFQERYKKMTQLSYEFQEYFDKKRYASIGGITPQNLVKYLEENRSRMDDIKIQQIYNKIGFMITKGRIEDVKKYIQNNFEKRKRKRLNIIKKPLNFLEGEQAQILHKNMKLIDIIEREHNKSLNKRNKKQE